MWITRSARFKRKELNTAQKWELIHRDKLTCVQCQSDIHLPDPKKPTLPNGSFHHIVPLVYGGENTTDNACILCRGCHIMVHSGSEDKEKYFTMFETFIRTGKLV